MAVESVGRDAGGVSTVSAMRRLLLTLALALPLAVGCATFRPATLVGAIRPLTGDAGGSCTAWAIGPRKWITAAHCIGHVTTLDGVTVEWLASDRAHDIALLRGPVSARLLTLATSEPVLGDVLYVFGYGLGRPTLLVLPGSYIAAESEFFVNHRTEMLIGIANGMPGMSGGPILWKGKVISAVTGGGTPTSPAHALGTGVPWKALRAFVARTGAEKE